MITTEYKNVSIDYEKLTNGNVENKDYANENRLVWEGGYVFDIIMKAIDENLRVQYDNGRIVSKDYASAYIQLINIALEKAINILTLNAELKLKVADMEIKDKELELKEKLAELELEFKRKELELKERISLKELELKEYDIIYKKLLGEQVVAQTKLYDRQLDGFKDNVKIKLLEAQLNAFSLIYSSGMLDFDETSSAFPEALKSSNLTKVYNDLYATTQKDWDSLGRHRIVDRILKAGDSSSIPV